MPAGDLPVAEFGFPGPLRDQLVAAILAGEKTTTTGLVADYEHENEPLPVLGERQVVVDSAGRPVAVIETTAVRVMRLTDVNLDHALGEGEGYTSVAEWRAGHEQFWHSAEMRQALGDPAFTVGDDPLVVAQEFRLVEMSDEATRHNQAAYDQIAGLYAARQVERERGFRDLKAAFVARLPRVADIADLGCGPADDGALFAQAGHHVIGIDRSAGMLAYAARALSGLVLQADLRRLPVASQSIDGIWCCAALLHVAHDQTMAALREMRRILRPDGCLALVTAAGQGARLEPVPYAPGTQRWFFYRGAVQLEEQLRDAGCGL